MSIHDELTAILLRYKRSEEKIVNNLDQFKNDMLNENRNALQTYSLELDKLNRSKKISINKNQQEIKKFQDDAEDNIRNLKNEIITSKKVYLESIELAQAKFLREQNDALKTHDEEIDSIDIELKHLREEYRVQIRKVEADKSIKLRQINDEYNTIKDNIEAKIGQSRKLADNDIILIKIDTKEHRENTDETYLTIKKTHTQTSIKFNEFINKRKKEHVNKIAQLKTLYEASLIPLNDDKTTIKINYQEQLANIQSKYAARVQTLNIQFDLQKDQYNKEIGNIIKTNSMAKTKINADFSALNNAIEETKRLDKNKQAKEFARKDILDSEKEIIKREYKSKIETLNKKLALAILSNKKDVKKIEVELQVNLFNHDLKHIEQINDWRFNKYIYEYENNQNILKCKSKYELQLLEINLKENLLKLNLNNDLLIEENSLKKDLLPIEHQLLISSLVQEREINLLNNDDETYQDIFNLKQAIITNKFFLDESQLRFELDLANEEKRNKEALINTEIQLELEQLKLRRNHSLNILKLNKDLQLSLLTQKNNIETIKKDSVVYEANLNINNLEARSLYETKKYRKDALIELEKRQAIIHEIKIKSQRQELQNKVERTVELAKNEANLHERVNQSLFNEIFILAKVGKEITTLVEQLFKLPSHPEIFRQFLDKIIIIFDHLKDEYKFLIEKFIEIDKSLYKARIDNMTEHKYRIKHEEIINVYSNNNNQIAAKRDELLKQYDDIQEQVFAIQNKKALNESIIDDYLKTNKNERSKDRKAIIKYNKIQIKVLKNEIKLLNNNLNESNKEIIRLSNKVIPLDKQINKLTKRQKDAEGQLDTQKNHEVIKYIKLEKIHLNSYNIFNNNLIKKLDIISSIYTTLIAKPYISNSFFTSLETKIEKNVLSTANLLVKQQQTFLSYWLDLYNITKDDQYLMFNSFLKTTNFALDRISKNHNRFLDNEEKEKNYYSKNYTTEVKRNNDLIIKASETMQQSIKDYQIAYRLAYSKVELDIENNKVRTDREILIVAENLKGVKDDFAKQYLFNRNKIEKSNIKQQLDFKGVIDNKNKDLVEVNRRNTIRTKVIIDRYEKDKDRNFKEMQSKNNRLVDEIKRINHLKLNDELQAKVSFKKHEKLVDLSNKEINVKVTKYFKLKRREQNKIVKKEKKTLIISYKFKVKQLK